MILLFHVVKIVHYLHHLVFGAVMLLQRRTKKAVGLKGAEKSIGRTRGGLNTKLHAIVDGLGNPVEFLISAGNDADSKHAIDLLKKVDITKSNILGDKAYGSKEIRSYITENGESYTIYHIAVSAAQSRDIPAATILSIKVISNTSLSIKIRSP